MNLLPALPILLPLAGGILCMLLRRSIAVQKAVVMATSLLLLLSALCLMAHTKDGTIAVMHVGGWQAPAPEDVTVTEGGTTQTTGTYTQVLFNPGGGLASGTYIAKRYDVRKTVSLGTMQSPSIWCVIGP